MPVLLIHSLALDGHSWDSVANQIADLDAIVVDLPGHGTAIDEPFTIANALRACIAALPPTRDPLHVAGCGIGALVADQLARHLRVEGFLALSWPPDQRPGALDQRADATAIALKNDSARFLADYRAQIARQIVEPTPVDSTAFVDALRTASRWRPAPPANRAFTIVARGSRDGRTSPKDALDLATTWSAALEEIAGAGHASYIDAPNEVAQLIRRAIEMPGSAPSTLGLSNVPSNGEQ